MAWLPQHSLVPQPKWQLWQARASLETLEKLYDELELASHVGVLVLWPSEDKVAVSTEEAIKAQLATLERVAFVTQQCHLTPADLVRKFTPGRDNERGPDILEITPKESTVQSVAFRPSEATQVQCQKRWTALALNSSRLLAVDSRGRLLAHLEEDTYRRLGLIGRGHNPRLRRKRRRHPVYGDGALVLIDLGQASSHPDSKYHKRIHTCLGRIADTLLWQITSLDGTEAPLVTAPDSQRTIAAQIRTGIAASPLSTARRQVLCEAFRERQSANRNILAQSISTVMDAIGQLMLGIDEQQQRNDDDDRQYYLRPLSVGDDLEATTNERVAFRLYEWGTEKSSLLPHRWYKQIVPIVWALHLASAQTPLDVVLYTGYHALPAEARPDGGRARTSPRVPPSTNVFGFFGCHHDRSICIDDDRTRSASIPFIVCEQPP